MKTLFKVCSFIMLGSGLVNILIFGSTLILEPLSELNRAVIIISFLVPGGLTLLTGLFGIMKKSYHVLITFGTLAILIRSMISFQGYNGIIPVFQYNDILLPVAYTVLVLLINHDEIETDLKNDEQISNK